jgi:hypothetical protein
VHLPNKSQEFYCYYVNLAIAVFKHVHSFDLLTASFVKNVHLVQASMQGIGAVLIIISSPLKCHLIDEKPKNIDDMHKIF